MRRTAWLLLFVLLLTLVFASTVLPQRLDVSVGEPAPENIKAPTEFVDRPTTERRREEAMAEVSEVYEQDPEVSREALAEMESLFATIRAARQMIDEEEVEADAISPESRRLLARRLRNVIDFELQEDQVDTLILGPEEVIDDAEDLTDNLLSFIFAQGVKPDNVDNFREQFRENLGRSELPQPLIDLLKDTGAPLIEPNMFLDEAETEARREEAAEAVDPEIILPGQVIVPDGQIITPDDMIRLRDAGVLAENGVWRIYLGAFFFSLILLAILAAYTYRLHPDVFASESQLVLLGMLVLGTLFISRLALIVSPYLAPVGVGALLIAVLLNGNLAVLAGLLLALSMAVIMGGDLPPFLVAFASTTVAAIAATRIKDRNDFMRAGFMVSLVNVAILFAYHEYVGGASFMDPTLWRDVMWSAGNGLLTAVLAIGSLPFLEGLFGMMTPIKLVELASPTQPLLRRLLEEAPGTYHHSILVANMVEPAVEAIGGDSLLARVGAYYHDVGKIRRPYLFIENQFGGENPHDKLSPNLSALIIISHVRDGVELAREEDLPEAIIDFIATHHGNMLCSYFYSRSREQNESEDVDPSTFRYPGPRPRTKEGAVLMLADAAEASARALSRPSPDRLRALVRSIIHERLEDGQLDKCDLTFSDLDRIADVFSQVLGGAFHRRLEYPEIIQGLKEDQGVVNRDSDQR